MQLKKVGQKGEKKWFVFPTELLERIDKITRNIASSLLNPWFLENSCYPVATRATLGGSFSPKRRLFFYIICLLVISFFSRPIAPWWSGEVNARPLSLLPPEL